MSQKKGGKAKALEVLREIPGVLVPRFITLPADVAIHDCEAPVEAFIAMNNNCRDVAVRSSAESEDGANASFAGMFTSLLHVPAQREPILRAVQEVRDSGKAKSAVVAHYMQQRGFSEDDNAVSAIVQEMIHSDIAGVIFSHAIDKRDGYYLVSVTSGLGDQVASGLVNGGLIRIARGLNVAAINERWLRDLVRTMRHIEQHFGSDSLDVEFAVASGCLYILQCRPITTSQEGSHPAAEEKLLLQSIATLSSLIENVHAGDVLGDMIDINPLELLGTDPSVLDTSVFRCLFSDNIVEEVRASMGYDPLHIGLIRTIAQKSYVSLRASAFSLRPRGIPESVYEKLFRVYRELLLADPSLQSRVEFDVFAMDNGAKLDLIMNRAALTSSEQVCVCDAFIGLRTSLDELSESLRNSYGSQLDAYRSHTAQMRNAPLQDMLDHTAEGTRFFVQVARLAFYWKNRFEETYPGEDLNELLAGHLQSVSSRQQSDLQHCRAGELSEVELIAEYGHLRPGQFSVFGESYADDPTHYLFSQVHSDRMPHVVPRSHRFETTVEFQNVLSFMHAREESKFLFSRALSQFIDRLKKEIRQCLITETTAMSCTWPQLNELLNGSDSAVVSITNRMPVILPPVIIPGKTDLRIVEFGSAAPTFITRKIVKAIIRVLEDTSVKADVGGAIVVIPNADPGFDYLFHSGAVGIITKSGGPASHMCIRAVELQMPACIGCGEYQYGILRGAQSVVLDCSSKQLIVS